MAAGLLPKIKKKENHERYRSRFQSTHDLMEARKVFPVFFAADQTQAQTQTQTQTQAQTQQ